jgi:hypothetical protein
LKFKHRDENSKIKLIVTINKGRTGRRPNIGR